MLLLAHQANSQKQLLLLKGEKTVLRLNPGDDFVYRLKTDKKIRSSYVNNLNETTVFTHRDSVPFHIIDRIYFRQQKFYNRLGARMIGAGILLFAFDQFNETVVQGKKASLDEGITTVSIALVGAGIPMVLIRKKSQRLNYKYRLLMVERGSIFYRESPKGSPYLQN
jgi:hypothetical protein